jgi:uncharacterized protein (TIGR03435 family)
MLRTALILSLSLTAPASGQTAPPTKSFEVASIRPTANGDPTQGYWSLPNTGEFHTHSLSLTWIIRLAFDVDEKQIEGKPTWLDADCYDITAKPEGGLKLTREQLRPLLQDLLAQRFHLAVHHETRLVPGYELVIAKSGAKLQPNTGGTIPNWQENVSPGTVKVRNATTAFLAQKLTPLSGLPCVDRTGLTGYYDISLAYNADLEHDSTLPSLFTALQESLGLKLEPRKVPVDFLVIDHLDRVPTDN